MTVTLIVALVAAVLLAIAVLGVQLDRDAWRTRAKKAEATSVLWEQEVGRVRREADQNAVSTKVDTPASWLEQVTAAQVVVHTRDERSIEGVLALVATDGLVLRTAKLLGARAQPLGGEVFLPRSEILFVQRDRSAISPRTTL